MSNGTWNFVWPSAGRSAHRAPTAAPTSRAATITTGPGPGRTMAVIVPNSAPMSICPSPPRLSTPDRKAREKARAIPTIGIMRLNVLRRPLPVNPPVSISPKAASGSPPVRAMTTAPKPNATTRATVTG